MKKTKIINFIVHGKTVEQIEGDAIDLDGIEVMKTSLAIVHGVSYDEVEFVATDLVKPDLSLLSMVNEDGVLMFKANQYAIFLPVVSVRPAMDITQEELFYEFLDLISKKDFNNALSFMRDE